MKTIKISVDRAMREWKLCIKLFQADMVKDELKMERKAFMNFKQVTGQTLLFLNGDLSKQYFLNANSELRYIFLER